MTGKGRQQITGQLGDVMKESVQAATSYVRSRAVEFGIEPPLFERKDIHVHVPEGATPKDGPSAGAAIAISMISVLTGIPVRCDVAMTERNIFKRKDNAYWWIEGKTLGCFKRRY